MFVSSDQELSLGQEAARDILSKERLSRDPQYVNPVREVGARIARVSGRPDFNWEFYTIDKPKVPNAFCLPGGKIFVYTGLFKYARDRHELAAVIGHEVGHAVARHGGERMSAQLIAQLGQQAAMAAIGERSPAAMQAFDLAFGLGTNIGVLLPFSRDQEYEADRIGIILMAKAGYDPRAALSFWRNMAASSKEGPPEFLSTHPVTSSRIAQLERHMPEAMSYYQGRK